MQIKVEAVKVKREDHNMTAPDKWAVTVTVAATATATEGFTKREHTAYETVERQCYARTDLESTKHHATLDAKHAARRAAVLGAMAALDTARGL